MKVTLLDRLIGIISPRAQVERVKARGQIEFMKRAYDAASTFNTDDFRSATSGSANAETRGAQKTIRNKSRDAVRNNPYAGKGLATIVSNTVGSGIVPNIKAKSKLQTRQLTEAWKKWGETTRCDSQGRHNFYGLQALGLRSIVESGEVLALKEINSGVGHQLRLLESDYIVSGKDTTSVKSSNEKIIQGIKLTNEGVVKSYFLYDSHPGDLKVVTKEIEVQKDKVIHSFRQDRPDQVRGVSWFHPVIRQLEDFNEFQQATLINRKVSACFTAFITTNDSENTLSAADLQAKREADNMLSPGQIKYLGQGESVQMASPAAVSGYDEYCRQTLRAIASGLGVTYEALTSDYSQVNFSSGRMGHIEFRRNVEMWRWSMLIPQFCEPAFQHFLEWARLSEGIKTDGVYCEWVCPSWALIDPDKEISAMVKSLRNGLTSRPKAILELGYDPEQLNTEISESNKQLDELDIVLDSDPRKTTQAGILQLDPEQNPQSSPPAQVKLDEQEN